MPLYATTLRFKGLYALLGKYPSKYLQAFLRAPTLR